MGPMRPMGLMKSLHRRLSCAPFTARETNGEHKRTGPLPGEGVWGRLRGHEPEAQATFVAENGSCPPTAHFA